MILLNNLYAEFDMKDLRRSYQSFILGLNDYRVARKVQRKLFDTYLYKEPILIEKCFPDNNYYSSGANSDIEIKNNGDQSKYGDENEEK